jgi:hypothetical protein
MSLVDHEYRLFSRRHDKADPPSKKAKQQEEEAKNRPANIRVMEIKFFANNTFASVAGLGESILRGRFHIIGEKRDHLWMRVTRFGFGRGVSGSVYRYVMH